MNDKISANVQQGLLNLLHASQGDAVAFEQVKTNLLASIEADLTTANAEDVETLKNLHAAVQDWDFPPPAKAGPQIDPKALQERLASAAMTAGPDLSELFRLIHKFEKEKREMGQAQQLSGMQQQFDLAKSEYDASIQAAEKRRTGALVAASMDIVGGAVQIGMGGASLGMAVKAAKTTRQATKQVDKATEQSDQLGQQAKDAQGTVKKTQDAVDTAQSKVDGLKTKISRLAEKKAAQTELNAAQAKLNQAKAAQTKSVDELNAAQTEVQTARAHAEKTRVTNDLQMRAATAAEMLVRGVSATIQALGRTTDACFTFEASVLEAEAKQIGTYRELTATSTQGGKEFADNARQTMNDSRQALEGIIRASADAGQTIARNMA